MTDKKLTSLITNLTKDLATKKDIGRIEEKVDTLLRYADAIEETTADHEKRLIKIESIPTIACKLHN